MKKIILLTVSLIFVLGAYAQEKTKEKNDTTRIKWGHSKIWIFPDKDFKADSTQKGKSKRGAFVHWGGFDLGICALTTADNQFQIPANEDIYNLNYFLDLRYNKSWYYSLNLLEKNFRVYKNQIYFITGLGMEWDSYNFRSNITLDPAAANTNASTTTLDTSSRVTYVTNQLKVAYLKTPILFEFNSNNTNAHKSFHLALGMELCYRVDSWTKQEYEINGYSHVVTRNDDYNLNALKYGLAVRAGYGGLTLFANYAFSPLFEESKGPEKPIFPLSVGVALSY